MNIQGNINNLLTLAGAYQTVEGKKLKEANDKANVKAAEAAESSKTALDEAERADKAEMDATKLRTESSLYRPTSLYTKKGLNHAAYSMKDAYTVKFNAKTRLDEILTDDGKKNLYDIKFKGGAK